MLRDVEGARRLGTLTSMKTSVAPILLAVLACIACPRTPPNDTLPDSGFATDGPRPPDPPPPDVLQCPGETMCPCSRTATAVVDDSGGDVQPHDDDESCPGPVLTCGPHGACTSNCAFDEHCKSGVSGESCLGGGSGMAGHCAVPCDPAIKHGGCPKTGDVQSECRFVLNTWVCGYD